jgi:hypothetical protein
VNHDFAAVWGEGLMEPHLQTRERRLKTDNRPK